MSMLMFFYEALTLAGMYLISLNKRIPPNTLMNEILEIAKHIIYQEPEFVSEGNSFKEW